MPRESQIAERWTPVAGLSVTITVRRRNGVSHECHGQSPVNAGTGPAVCDRDVTVEMTGVCDPDRLIAVSLSPLFSPPPSLKLVSLPPLQTTTTAISRPTTTPPSQTSSSAPLNTPVTSFWRCLASSRDPGGQSSPRNPH